MYVRSPKALGECNEEKKLYAGNNGYWCSFTNPPSEKKISYQTVEIVKGEQFQADEHLTLPTNLLPPELKPKMVLRLLKSLGFIHFNVQKGGSEYHVFACKTKEVQLKFERSGNYP